jgi:hypothetical protein
MSLEANLTNIISVHATLTGTTQRISNVVESDKQAFNEILDTLLRNPSQFVAGYGTQAGPLLNVLVKFAEFIDSYSPGYTSERMSQIPPHTINTDGSVTIN